MQSTKENYFLFLKNCYFMNYILIFIFHLHMIQAIQVVQIQK